MKTFKSPLIFEILSKCVSFFVTMNVVSYTKDKKYLCTFSVFINFLNENVKIR